MKKLNDSKFWQWFRWVLLALIIAAVLYVAIFVIDWSPRSRKLDATPTPDPVAFGVTNADCTVRRGRGNSNSD